MIQVQLNLILSKQTLSQTKYSKFTILKMSATGLSPMDDSQARSCISEFTSSHTDCITKGIIVLWKLQSYLNVMVSTSRSNSTQSKTPPNVKYVSYLFTNSQGQGLLSKCSTSGDSGNFLAMTQPCFWHFLHFWRVAVALQMFAQ